ncbi:MAG: gas vesicle protein [Acidobacteria bacterium]|nr:MAG: gas vesicle protein [Acidobacteriota bacterium]
MPQITHSTNGSSLADVLELVLDKGLVIAGDIRIKLVEVELLTINLRVLISSVDRARELPEAKAQLMESELGDLRTRLERLEQSAHP